MLLMVTTTIAQYEATGLPFNYGTFATIRKNKTATMVGRSRWKENEDVGCSVVWLEVFLLLGEPVAE